MRNLALVLAVLTPAIAWGDPLVVLGGECPGVGVVDVTGLTPSGSYMLLYASDLGSAAVTGGPCAGATTGLLAPRRKGPITADAAGTDSKSPNLSGSKCGTAVQALDLTTCALSNVAVGFPPAVPSPDVEFPSTDSWIFDTYGAERALGDGGGGVLFVAGAYIRETFATGLPEVSSLTLDFAMDDQTNGYCTVGTLTFDVSINGTWVGSYAYVGGSLLGAIAFSESYAFPPVLGGGAGGDTYEIRLTANETVCSGGGSYNWYAGGSAVFGP